MTSEHPPVFHTALTVEECKVLAEYQEARAVGWAALNGEEEAARRHAQGRARFWRTILATAPGATPHEEPQGWGDAVPALAYS